MTLTEFLLARIAEDEGFALPARPYTPGDAPMPFESALHIARHSPARVMAECDAKVRIVARYKGSEDAMNNQPDPLKRMVAGLIVETLLDVMKALALIWADHQDYQPEWKP